MKEVFVEGRTLPEAYHSSILKLNDEGEVLSANDWGQLQKEISMTFTVHEPLSEPRVSRLYIGGFRELKQYVMEILNGILDFKIGQGNCWEYTYHDRLFNYGGFDQIDFVINELKRNSDSRRAVALIRDNKVDPFNSDPACLQHIQYFIRGGELHCKTLMRSNDAAEACFMNAFAFIELQAHVANELGIRTGSYTHRANSFHCYEKDFKLLEQYVHGIKSKRLDELTYEYEGYYKELMDESVPDIIEMVEGLRRK